MGSTVLGRPLYAWLLLAVVMGIVGGVSEQHGWLWGLLAATTMLVIFAVVETLVRQRRRRRMMPMAASASE